MKAGLTGFKSITSGVGQVGRDSGFRSGLIGSRSEFVGGRTPLLEGFSLRTAQSHSSVGPLLPMKEGMRMPGRVLVNAAAL
jgi:hypothetical protein